MIRLIDAIARHGDFELRIDALDVREGEYVVLLGPSGAGKSVLLETIAGLRLLDSGRVLFDGEDVTAWPPERRRVGLVSQKPSLFPHMTVRRNILFGQRYAREAAGEFTRRADELAQMLRVDHLLDRGVGDLSGGEAQRIALARALVTRPRVLLLDEPLGPLDENLREELAAELRGVHDRLHTTTVHVTHDQSEARALGDRVAVMSGGRVLQIGTVEEVFSRPADDFVARFLRADC
jgi:ABC-type sugar transport system ATPase subunit